MMIISIIIIFLLKLLSNLIQKRYKQRLSEHFIETL